MAKQRRLVRWLDELEAVVDWARDRVRGERGRGPFRIVAYRGHGTPDHLRVRGRVLEGAAIPSAREEDGAMRNLIHTVRRMESDEVPAARVRARLGEVVQEALADDEGYFRFDLRLPAPLPEGPIWREVELELLDPLQNTLTPVCCTGQALVPPPGARYGLISDIDDTVIKTDVANLLSMARLVLLTNAHTRLPFEGVGAFYRALHAGPEGAYLNPVFYVSSSPWNFYDLLEEVFSVHGVPKGPLFLKDYSLSRTLTGGHQRHKLAAIEEILTTHWNLPFVLLGDSGQEDPEIYREVVRRFPGRVLAVYIRDVSDDPRDAEVHAIAEEMSASGVPLLLTSDTVAAAEHAAGLGLIDPAALPEIRGEKARDEAAPGAFESLTE